MIKSYTIFIIICLVIISCTNQKDKQHNASEIPVIDFRKLKRNKPTDVYQFSDIQFVQLAHNQNVLLSDNIKLHLVDNYLFVFDFVKQSLYRFQPNGQFINSIGLSGKGPQEYSNVLSFAVNTLKQKVGTLCNDGLLIQEYSYNGNYLESLDVPIYATDFTLTAEGKYWYYTGIGNGKTDYRLHYSDTINPVKSFLPLKTKCFGVTEQHFTKYNNEIWFRESFFPTIYSLNNGKVKPAFKIEFGKGEINETDFINAKNPFAFIEKINREGYCTTACLVVNVNIINILILEIKDDEVNLYELLVSRNKQKPLLVYYKNNSYKDLLSNSKPVFIDDNNRIHYLTSALNFIKFIKSSKLNIDISNIDVEGNQIMYSLALKINK